MAKKKSRQVKSLLLVLVLVMGLMAATLGIAGAAGEQAQIGTVKYATLELALAAPPAAGQTVEIIANATLAANADLPAGVILQVNPGVTLTVPAGFTLTARANVINNGSILIHGTANLANGTTAATGSGAFKIYGDGVLQIGGAPFIAAAGALALDAPDSAVTLAANAKGGMDMNVVNGNLTIQGPNDASGVYLIGKDDTVTVASGCGLNLAVKVRNGGTMDIAGQLRLQSGGSLVCYYNELRNQGPVAWLHLGAAGTVIGADAASGLSAALGNTTYKWLPADLTVHDENGSWQPVCVTNGANRYASLAQASLEATGSDNFIVTGNATLGSDTIAVDQTLTVASDGVLTLDAGAVLQIKGSLTVNGSLKAAYNAASPGLLARIIFDSGASFSTAASNFSLPNPALHNYRWAPTDAGVNNGPGSWQLAAVAISPGTISGCVGTALTGQDLTLTVSGDSFISATAADYGTAGDISAWFTNLPAGLTANVTGATSQALTVTLGDTPNAAQAGTIAVTVPAAALVGAEELIAPVNAIARWQIRPAAPAAVTEVAAAGDTLTVKTADPVNAPGNEFTVTLSSVVALTGDETWSGSTGAALALGRSYNGSIANTLSFATAYKIWARVAATLTAPASDATASAAFWTIQDAPAAPVADATTATSITLLAAPGCEYRRGTGEWGDWSETLTYNLLSPASPYTFYQRAKAIAGGAGASEPVSAILYTAAATPAAPVQVTADATALTVAAAEPTNAAGNEYTVTLAGVSALAGGEVWTPATAADLPLSQSYAGTVATAIQPGQEYTIWLRVAANGPVAASAPATLNIWTKPATPAAPTVAAATADTITLATVSGCEYRLADGEWSDQPLFSDLTAASPYTFTQRVKAIEGGAPASDASPALTAYTAYATPAAPVSVTATDAALTVAAAEATNVAGNQYTLTLASVSALTGAEVWTAATPAAALALNQSYDGATAAALTPATQYILWLRVAANGDIPASAASQLAIWTLPSTPVAPTATAVTADSITLNPVIGCEYQVNGGAWVAEVAFTDLTPASQYNFCQRVKAIEGGAPASAASPVLTLYTAYATPAAPTAVTATSAAVQIAAAEPTNVAGNEYTVTLATIVSLTGGEVWTPATAAALELSHSYIGATAATLTPATHYTLWLRTAANGAIPASAPSQLSLWTLPATPAAPTMASVTENRIVLDPTANCEYRLNDGAWSDDVVFDGLTPATQYSFYQRIKAVDGGAPASAVSPALSVYTAYALPTEAAYSVARNGVITFDATQYQVNNQADFLGLNIDSGSLLPDGQLCYIRRIATVTPPIPASAAYEFMPTAAYVADALIAGVVGTPLAAQSVTVTLTCATFANASVAEAGGWVLDLPAGLSASFSRDANNAHQGTLTISGTPTVPDKQILTVVIPANQQNGGSALATEANAACLWSILPAAPAASAFAINFLTETASFDPIYEVWNSTELTTAQQFISNTSIKGYIVPAGATPMSLYMRVRATVLADPSPWTTLTIPARPEVIKPSLDFAKETYTVALEQIFSIAPSAALAPVLNLTGTGTPQAFSGTQIAANGQATNSIFTQVKATASQFAGVMESLVVPTRPATPTAKVDYKAEELTGLSAASGYLINDVLYTSDKDGNLAIVEAWYGATLSLKAAATDSGFASLAQSIKLAARPAAPKESLFTLTQPTSAKDSGSISGIAASMEYSTDKGKTWTVGTAKPVTGLEPGAVLVRYAATAAAPASAALTLTIVDYSALAKISNGTVTQSLTTAVKKNEATLSITDANLKTLLAASNSGLTTVDTTDLDADIDTVSLSANLVKGLAAQANISGLLVKLDSGYIQFDRDALDTLAAKAGSTGVTISIYQLEQDDLNSAQLAAVGKDPVWDVVVSGADGQIIQLNGWAQISLYYGAVSDPLSLRSCYMNGLGRCQKLVNAYSNGWVTFSVNHVSLFTLSEDATLTGWLCPYTDVSRNDWFYVYVRDLSMEGVVNGYPDYSFRPYGQVTYGEALKLILLASGYQAQFHTNAHWAGGYLASAQQNNLIGQVEDLNAAISRSAIADLAYKALHLSTPQNASTFSDTTDAAVRALYEAGIVEGSFDASGNRLYKPNDSISRAEITTIVWRITEYR